MNPSELTWTRSPSSAPTASQEQSGSRHSGHSRFIHVHTRVYRNKSAHMQSGNHYIDTFRCHRLCSLERRPRCFPCMCLSSAPGSPENIHLSVGKPASERSQGSSITSTRSCFMTTSSTKDAQSLSSNKAFLTVPIRKPYQAFLSPTAGRLIHIADSCFCFSSQRK